MRRFPWAAALALLAGSAGADEGVTVLGAGEHRAKPDRLEFEFRNNGVAEIAGDASVKLRDAQVRTEKAFAKLSVPNLKLEPAPIGAAYEATQQQQYFNGMPTQAPNPKLDLGRQTKVVVSGIDKLSDEDRLAMVAKLLDAARDAGAKFGSSRTQPQYVNGVMQTPGFLRFGLSDPAAARDAATKKAYDDAQARAAKLAALSGGAVGPALDIVEESAAAIAANPAFGMAAPNAVYSTAETDDSLDVIVRVRLKIRFKLLPAK